MSFTNMNTLPSQKQEVHELENGIIVTIEPLYEDMSKLILSGPWYKFLHIQELIRSDNVRVQGYRGPYGFKHEGQLNRRDKTFTCNVFVREIEKDMESLSDLVMVNPDCE